MKFVLVATWPTTTLSIIGSRFASGEHSNPPEPFKLLARWHDPAAKTFWLVVDTPDAQIMQEWLSRWTDIISWDAHPILDDAEVGAMLGNLL